MLIDITNTCQANCPHCLQCASSEPQHMSLDTVIRSFDFAKWSKSKVILISGGELTLHPNWIEFVEIFSKNQFFKVPNWNTEEKIKYLVNNEFLKIILPTNGYWLGTPTEDDMIKLLKENNNVCIQITSIPELYGEYSRISKEIKRFNLRLKSERLKKRCIFEENIKNISMLELGRACFNEKYIKMAREDTRGTTSCFASSLISVQTRYPKCIEILESRGRFCHPLIDWRGNIHWSESWLCPSFANVYQNFSDIAKQAHEWVPCGKCEGYKKLLAKNDYKYNVAKVLMGIS